MPKVCILGGGIIGLALAFELRRGGATVLVIDRGERPATWAAAGMLAPQAEGLTHSPLAALGLKSRDLWPSFALAVEQVSGETVGYLPSGILLPASAANADALRARASGEGQWWQPEQLRTRFPGIAPQVVGGLWFEKDACLDPRRALAALTTACERLGVEFRRGVDVLGPADDDLSAVATSAGPICADAYVLAQGSWSGEWLDLPVMPLKGQMLALAAAPERCSAVLFGEGIYLVPRRDGRLVVGATQEQVDFAPGNTAGGIAELLAGALALLPELANARLLETWWGFRPATPDTLPLIGRGRWDHLWLATGHHRNGILLAPLTACLVASEILTGRPEPLLAPFSWRRFAGSETCRLGA